MDPSFFKILLVGNSGVGKSCILLQFCDNVFFEEQPTTIGVDFKLTKISVDNETVKLSIFDTAGQERFKTLTASYYRGAHGIIFIYDITDRASFNDIQEWMKEADTYSTFDDVVKMVIGNKIDKDNDESKEPRVVTREEGTGFAYDNKMLFLETSAKTREGIDEAFGELTRKILQVDSFAKQATTPGANVSLREENAGNDTGCCF